MPVALLALPKRCFRLFALLDVSNCSIPSHYVSVFVTQRRGPEQEPAICAIEAPQARLAIDRLARGHIVSPDLDKVVEIVGVDARFPSRAPNLLRRCAGVFEPAPVERLHEAIGAASPGYCRDRVQCEAKFAFGFSEARFAVSQRPFGLLRELMSMTPASPLVLSTV